ncbi:hypothetical protein ACEXOS_015115 [Herbiconiux sp. P16]|uniref:hypothetical protein n=1 Tax=Herbiconiux wuyangfengii TaxID=3342794 RepID=UPI0035B93A94
MMHDIPKDQLQEMLRASSGVVTALIANDPAAANAQALAIVAEQAELSAGDSEMLAFRMVKQLEASARITHQVIRSLAPRLGLTEAQTQEILAQSWA